MTKRSHPVATALTHAAPRRPLARRAPAPLVLEQRIMFDAAGVEAAVRHAAEHVAADAAAPADTGERSHVVTTDAAVAPAQASRTEVVFIEDNVGNVAQLVAGVRPGVEVIMLDHTRDGLQQMLDALKGHAPVDAIHLVSHGATGQLSLGTQSLSVDNIDSASAALAQLGTSLNAGGDLLLYGCDVAQGATGAGFVERMASLTGADVAASTDVTGSAAFAGNWTLEAHSGAIETKALELDRAGWSGELVNTVYNANWQTLTFDGSKSTHLANAQGASTDGESTGDITRYNSVIMIGGQAIDAVVTTTLDRATMIDFDSTTDPSTTAAYFQPTMKVGAAGGGVSFKIDFYLGGTYTGAGTGTAVTLQNVVVNSYDIDGYGNNTTDRQFQVFQGFDRYELATTTKLVTSTQTDGSVQFLYNAQTAVNNGTMTADAYRVKVYYDSMSSFVVKSGVAAGAGSAGFNGQAYFALDFSVGPNWTGETVITGTPAAKIAYSTASFAEASANDGSITATATITLANGSFTGTDDAAVAGVTFSNLPAGLTAHVTRTSATTALLSFTGNALAHANANDVNNFGISFGDAAFTTGKSAAVTGATRADLVLDFADPVDTTAPVVTARTDSYAENRAAGTVVSTVSAADAVGVTGFQFAATQTNLSADGYFAIASNGAITLTTAGAASGSSANDYELTPHTFVMGVQARDAAGNWSAAQSITLNVTNIDEVAPAFASAATGQANENQAVLYTAAAGDDVDFTNHAVTYALAAGGDAARLTIDAGTGVVRLAAGTLDFETRSSYTFTVQARDATGNMRSQAVTITVTDIDEIAPTVTITSDKAALAAGATANLTFTFSEDVGTSFTAADIVLESGTIGPLVKVDATRYTAVYTPGTAIQDAAVSISIAPGQVQDNAGNANGTGASLSLAVDTAAPSITGATGIAVDENTTAVRRFTASEAVTWSIAGGEDAARFTLAADGTLAFASAPDFEHPLDGTEAGRNTYIVNLRAVDGFGNATVQAVTVTVGDVNEAPLGAGTAFQVAEDVRYTGTLPAAIDPDTDTLTYALATAGAHGQATVHADGTFSYQGAPDYHGVDAFSYTVSDGKGGTATYSVAVTVTAVNDAPVAADANVSTDEDTPLSNHLPVASDSDGDHVTYALDAAAQHGSVTVAADGSYRYTPADNFNGSDSFRYSVVDGQGGRNVYTVNVRVNAVNDAPVAADATIAAVEDMAVTGNLPGATDTEGDSVTYAVDTGPQHGVLTLTADGSYLYAPSTDYHGQDTFTYTVSDAHGGSSTHTVGITVTAVNDAPVAADTRASTDEDRALTGTLPQASDIDGDSVTYAVSTDAVHGTVTVNANGSYVYTPARDFNGSDSFTYTVVDSDGGKNTYTVAITVNGINDAPVASSPAIGAGTVGEALAPVVIAPFSDIDSAAITYSATRADGTPLPAWVTFDPATLTFTGTPPAGASGTLVLLVTGSDGASSATTAVTLAIRDAAVPMQSVTIAAMSKDTGVSALDFITADGTANRTVSGTLDAPLGINQVVRVSFDGGVTFATAAVTGTSWSAVDTGAHRADWTVAAHVANSVTGSTGTQTSQRVVLDSAAPAAPTVAPVASASTTPVVTGTATLAPGETLSVTIDGKAYDVTPQNGTWSVTPATPLVPGRSYAVATTVRDSAGNTTVDPTAGTIVISAPVPPQLQPQDAVVAPTAAAPVAPVTVNDTALPVVAPVIASPVVPVSLQLAPGSTEVVIPGSVASNDMLMAGSAGRAAAYSVSSIDALRQAAELSDVYTRTEGFRTVVAKADEPALVLFQGVPDQFIDAGNRMALVVPADAFAHTQPKAIVQLTATLQDGRPLPSWVTFTGQTGQFQGEPPAGLAGELRIKLTARDMDGREATALFRINVGQAKALPGKSGLSEQLRQSGAVRGMVRAGGRG